MKIKIMNNKTGEVKVVNGEVVDNRENFVTVKSKGCITFHSYPKCKYTVRIEPISIYTKQYAILFESKYLGELCEVLPIPEDVETYPHLELYLNQLFEIDDISVLHVEDFKGYPIRF